MPSLILCSPRVSFYYLQKVFTFSKICVGRIFLQPRLLHKLAFAPSLFFLLFSQVRKIEKKKNANFYFCLICKALEDRTGVHTSTLPLTPPSD